MSAQTRGGPTVRQRIEFVNAAFSRQKDLLLVLLIAAVVALIAAPLPVIVLDVLIVVNFGLSIVVLLAAVSATGPLALSSFPSLLLFTTLLRLGLNIASTKVILLTAHGPRIVEAFGSLVIGGNYVVGAIVFLILSVVQFIVIAKGSERAAEVSARFTLDAMPGKQMAIDADMRAGLITMHDARERRLEIERESKMHGGMDGAMKFVKGDAIAGLVIAVITIVGGIAVGAGMRGMSVGDAAQRFAVLTIGDSMVAQIPSLLLSIAAGVLITQAGNDGRGSSVASLLLQQISDQPRGLVVAGGLLLLAAAVPGFPAFPFLVVALSLLGPGLLAMRRQALVKRTTMAPIEAFSRDSRAKAPPMISTVPAVMAQPLTLRVAPSVSQRLNAANVNAQFIKMRMNMVETLALPFPGIRMIESAELEPGGFDVQIYDVVRYRGQIPPQGILIAVDAGQPLGAPIADAPPLEDLDPRWRWANAPSPEAPSPPGASMVALEALLARAVQRVLIRYGASMIGMGEATALIRMAEREHPEMVAEVAKLLTINKIAEVLKRLAEESVSLRDMRNIIETLSHAALREKDPVMLTEQVRMGLSSQTCQRLSAGTGIVQVAVLSQQAEATIRGALQESRGNYLPFTAEETQLLVARFRAIAASSTGGGMPVLAVHLEIRRYLRKIIEPHAWDLWVVSFGELVEAREVVVLGDVDFEA